MGEANAGWHRVVIKVGSSVLTDQAGRLLPERIQRLAAQVAESAAAHQQPILVSSGAIACGMARLGLPRRPKALAQLQACAAIGQGELMHLYTSAFARHSVLTAQVLLTQEDCANRARFHNAKQTLLTLLHRRVVPIVNENDTVAVEEITFGDNDRLAAMVASAVDAQLLVILSDVDGFIQDGRVLQRVESPGSLRASDLAPAGERQTTKGGMASKLEAARMVGRSGIPMVIANGLNGSALRELLAGQPVGTLFVPPRGRLTLKKWWIAFAMRRPQGTILVDDGATAALRKQGKSLLASGIREVRGPFEAGAFVAVVDPAGAEIGRGICNFSSSELARVRGLRSPEAAKALGAARMREVIHRDQLVLTEDVRR